LLKDDRQIFGQGCLKASWFVFARQDNLQPVGMQKLSRDFERGMVMAVNFITDDRATQESTVQSDLVSPAG
jgi:hypothetical protein